MLLIDVLGSVDVIMIFNKKKNRIAEYPSTNMLHNALYLLMRGDTEGAYQEICWAMIKADVPLDKKEEREFDRLRGYPVV